MPKNTPNIVPYEEHHFQNVDDVGVAFDGKRVWVCLNGASLLRASIWDGRMIVEYTPPKEGLCPPTV